MKYPSARYRVKKYRLLVEWSGVVPSKEDGKGVRRK